MKTSATATPRRSIAPFGRTCLAVCAATMMSVLTLTSAGASTRPTIIVGSIVDGQCEPAPCTEPRFLVNFGGTAAPGVDVKLFVDDVHVDSTTSFSSGDWYMFALLTRGCHLAYVRAESLESDREPFCVYSDDDRTRPVIDLDDHPPELTNSTRALFTFSATDPDDYIGALSFVCALDEWGAQFPCNDLSADFPNLSEGWHTFIVVATDLAGNDDRIEFSWRIDVTPPAVEIASPTLDLTRDTTAEFAISASDPDDDPETLQLTCGLDEQAPVGCDAGTVTQSDLSDGAHTFVVRASDPAGNVGTASFTWRVDTTPPTSSFSTMDGGVLLELAPVRQDPVEGASSDVSGIARVEVLFWSTVTGASTNGRAELHCAQVDQLCPWTATPPSVPGSYFVSVFATDRAGNLDGFGATITIIVV